MSDAIQVSKLRNPLLGVNEKALTMEEAFFLGTKGGGEFFGKSGMGYCGSFEPGFEFDALVINDKTAPFALSVRDRLERVIYICDDRDIKAKYARGKQCGL
jgi:guanine deaminase